MTARSGGDEVLRSLSIATLGGSLDSRMSAAHHAGFDAVDLAELDFVATFRSSTQLRRRAEGLGIEIRSYQPFRDLEGGTDEQFVGTLERARRKLDLVAELGARVLIVDASTAPYAHADDDVSARQLAAVAEEARAREVLLAYRAAPDAARVKDLAHAWRIVALADHPNLGLALETGQGESCRDILLLLDQLPSDKIFHLRFTDTAGIGRRVERPVDGAFATEDDLELPSVLAAICATDYAGPLTVGSTDVNLMNRDPERAARAVMLSLLALEDAARRRLTAEATTAPAAALQRLAHIPEAVELSGYAFVELAVDGGSANVAEVQMRSLGLELVGRHRTKSVTMWARNDARVLINTSGKENVRGRSVEATISAFGVVAEDPVAAAERAQYLHAHSMFRRRAQDEADLAAIMAPDDLEVFFCSSRPDGAGAWLSDFSPAGTIRTPDDGARGALQSIDHVALPYSEDRFDEAVGFFGAILGLEPQELVQLGGRTGGLRSRALCSSSRGFRLALNVMAGMSGFPSGRPAQHIAFSSRDVLATAAAFRAVGVVPQLAIPDNYYDDLATRTDLPAERVEELRRESVLYDDDGHGGQFLHMYTPMVGELLFFEVVQRIGHYDGYAARNAPVRVSAHRARGRRTS